MKIYILLAHPDKNSFNGQIADTYLQAAQAQGHEVRLQRLGEMQFDPILHEGFKKVQPLEPDLQQAQENIKWCDKWVIVYPVWWGSLPALFKGFLDRTLLPNFAFKYRPNSPFWDKYLAGKKAEIITTSDAPAWFLWWQYRNSDLNTLRQAVLWFCGVKTIKTTRISNMRFMKEEQRQKWLAKIAKSVR